MHCGVLIAAADGWRANSGGAGIEVWYFHEPVLLNTSGGRCFVIGGPT
jgi:hypothetical protein